MKPSVILDEPSVAAEARRYFSIARGTVPVAVYCDGLAGAEFAAIEILTADVDPVNAADGDWAPVSIEGNAQQLTADNNVVSIYAPGEYSLRIPSAAGAVKAGLY